MKIFVFEFICGGGLWGQGAASELAPLGGAMLRAVIEDIAALGVGVVTTRDEQVSLALPEGVEVIQVDRSLPFDRAFDAALSRCDAALIIAPEFHQLLETLSQRVINAGKRLIGCDPTGVAACSDKLSLATRLRRACIATPRTLAGLPAVNELADFLPMVVKPRFGAGCEDTFVIERESELAGLPPREDWISQPLAPGLAGSVAFIVMGPRNLIPLRAGLQKIAKTGPTHAPVRGARRLAYSGGVLPLQPHVEARLVGLARGAIQGIAGLRGFVGVDVIIGDRAASKDCVIEINPRITVAYVGLRALSKNNLAAWVLDAAGISGHWSKHPSEPDWRQGQINYAGDGTAVWSPPSHVERTRTVSSPA